MVRGRTRTLLGLCPLHCSEIQKKMKKKCTIILAIYGDQYQTHVVHIIDLNDLQETTNFCHESFVCQQTIQIVSFSARILVVP